MGGSLDLIISANYDLFILLLHGLIEDLYEFEEYAYYTVDNKIFHFVIDYFSPETLEDNGIMLPIFYITLKHYRPGSMLIDSEILFGWVYVRSLAKGRLHVIFEPALDEFEKLSKEVIRRIELLWKVEDFPENFQDQQVGLKFIKPTDNLLPISNKSLISWENIPESPKNKKVLQLWLDGKSSQQIAEIIAESSEFKEIDNSTVRNIIYRLRKKYGIEIVPKYRDRY